MKLKNKKGFKIIKLITKIISWCAMAILCVIGALLVFYLIINKIASSKGENPPLGLYTIISPSMTPIINVYDVVFVVKEEPEKIQIGDVISYYSTNSFFGNTPITHRVVEKHTQGNIITFRTRGDANPVMDEEIIYSNNVIGVTRFVIPQLGRIQFFLASRGGWFIVILIPALGIIIYDVIKLFKLIKIKNKMDDTTDEVSEEKNDNERIQQLLSNEIKEHNEKNNDIIMNNVFNNNDLKDEKEIVKEKSVSSSNNNELDNKNIDNHIIKKDETIRVTIESLLKNDIDSLENSNKIYNKKELDYVPNSDVLLQIDGKNQINNSDIRDKDSL